MIFMNITLYAYNHIKYRCTWLLLHNLDTMRDQLKQNNQQRNKIKANIETIEDILYKRSGYAD